MVDTKINTIIRFLSVVEFDWMNTNRINMKAELTGCTSINIRDSLKHAEFIEEKQIDKRSTILKATQKGRSLLALLKELQGDE